MSRSATTPKILFNRRIQTEPITKAVLSSSIVAQRSAGGDASVFW